MYIPRLKPYYALAVALYCGAIFFLSAQEDLPSTDLIGWMPGADKVAHAVLYGGLAALLSFGLRRSNDFVPFGLHFFAPIVFVALYGISDEIHQRYVPTRTFDPLDIAADVAGAVAVQVALCLYLWKAVDEEMSP